MEFIWNGFKAEKFEFESKEAIIVFPDNRDEQGNIAIKTEYWNAFPDVEINLVKNGFHLCYLKNDSRLAPKSDCDAKARFIKYLAKTYNLREKCVPVGMSCGGAHAVRFAGFYPELIACMFIDAPVLNFASWPGLDPEKNVGAWTSEFLKAYPGMKRYKLFSFSEHPINMADTLVENKIPVVLVYGEEDMTVNWTENGKLLVEAYEGTDLMKVIPVWGRGHHPHGLVIGNGKTNAEIYDHIIKICREVE